MTKFDLPQFLLQLAEVLSPALIALLSYASYLLTTWLRQRIKPEKAQHAIEFATGAVADVVASASDETVEAFREAAADGAITTAELFAIRDAGLKAAKRQLDKSAMETLKLLTDDADEYLWTRMKAEVRRQAPAQSDVLQLVLDDVLLVGDDDETPAIDED